MGIKSQLGVGEETTHGTAVTVNRFYEFEGDGPTLDIQRIESAGIRSGGRVIRSDRWVAGSKTVGGDLTMELHNKSFGLWLKHMFGTVATTQPAAGTDPTVYDHTATPGDLPAGLTVQVGRDDETGTVRAFTYEGCVVDSWEVSCAVGEIGKLKVTLNGEDETTTTALATASYPSSTSLLAFTGASLTIGGSSVDVTDFTLTGTNALKTDRGKLGSQLRRQPLETSLRQYGGNVTAYFPSLTAYNRFVNGTEAALVASFVGPTISNAYTYKLEFTCNVRFDGATSTGSGREEIMQPLPFVCVDSGSGPGSAITAVYRTTDTTP